MEPQKIFADLEIKSIDGAPSIYSVKLDGQEIAHYISSLALNINACGLAELILKVNVEKISVNSRCLWHIPEPYGSYVQRKTKGAPDDQGVPLSGP